MFSYQYAFIAMAAVVCLCSCATPTPAPTGLPAVPTAVEWTFAKGGIRVSLKSDHQLNLFQRRPHALHACIYQLRDPNGFNQFVEEKDGLQKLLECGRFDGSVSYAKRVVLQPGRETEEVMDRADGTRYVGLVAGYYNLQKETAVRLFPVPVTKVGVWPASSTVPGVLLVNLMFGPQQIILSEAPAQ